MAEKKKAVQSSRKQVRRGPKTKTSTAKKNSKKKKQSQNSVSTDVVLIVLIAFSLLVFFSLFTPFMGSFGQWMEGVMKGLLGAGAIVAPPVVIAFSIWALAGKEQLFFVCKAIGAVLFVLSISLLGQLFSSGGRTYTASFFEQAGLFFANGTGLNGGMIGGLLGWGLKSALGFGSYLVAFAMLAIGVVMGTGKSLITGVQNALGFASERKRVKEAKIKAKAENIRQKEARRLEKMEADAEKQRLREERMAFRREKKAGRGFFNILLEDDGAYEGETVDKVEASPVPTEKEERQRAEEQKEEPKEEKKKTEKLIEVLGMGNFGRKKTTEEAPKALAIDIVTEPQEAEEPQQAPTIFGAFAEEECTPKAAAAEALAIGAAAQALPKEEMVVQERKEEVPLEAVTQPVSKPKEEKKEPKEEGPKAVPAEAPKKTAAPEESSMEAEEQQVEAEVAKGRKEEKEVYQFPPLSLLGMPEKSSGGDSRAMMIANAKKLEETLASFGVTAKVTQINQGPTVTRYELAPSQGVKVSKIVNLADDLALNLAATGIRIEAPIPGKAAVGIEVPNREPQSVYLRKVLESEAFQTFPSKLAFALGEDIAGNAIVTDIAKMPHLLIAGATGSGKSVCINTLITSILYKATPEEVKLLLVDPKVVELSIYNGIPHLLIPVVTDPKKAAGALNWAVREMLGRYQKFADAVVRDIKGYNAMVEETGEGEKMPQIVIIIDELADLMMAAPGDVEDAICRLAQMARAAGLHLIIATQRPSVDVITGVIKANIPSRLAFAVSSGIDSRTILDSTGAEKLLGKGDMLFHPLGMNKPVRIQGAFVTDKEVESIVTFLKEKKTVTYDTEMIESITAVAQKNVETEEADDALFDQAVDLVVEKEKASASMLQRQFRIGYNRAARLIDALEERGIVGPDEGSKPRRVLMTKAQWLELRYPTDEDEGE